MTTPKDILGQVHGGRVLDVATGAGGFIHFLLEGLQDYREIIGIDSVDRGKAAFEEAFKDKPNVRFQVMDALQMDFPDDSFDLACISNSLHHLDAEAALRQMKRILRPGGTLLVAEMYCDNQRETQMTHVELHHWWGAVDTVGGVYHRETYRREELVEMVSRLGLSALRTFDLSDLSEDPKSPDLLNELDSIIDRYIQRAEGHPDLQARGEQLRKRVHEIGFHSATTLAVLGQK
jgi:ubiquinone/menaquinone biosynthesis C-methylase UbiE